MTDVTRRWMVGALMGGGVVAAAGRAAAVADLRPHARPATGVRPELRQSASNAHPDRHAHARSAEDLIAEAKLGGQVAFLVADARTGQVLEGHNVDLAMPPASVAKTLTTAYALETLGKDYRFKTQVVITGPVANGRVQGDLILWGGGDPTLSSDGLAALASQVAKAGIKGITGRFLVADGALPHVAIIDPTQPPEANYNPGISGLNLDFNRVYFSWEKRPDGWAVRMEAWASANRPLVRATQMTVVDRGLPYYVYNVENGVEKWSVSSRVLTQKGARWLPVREPGAYAGDAFHSLAAARGIDLPAPQTTSASPGGTVVAVNESADLRTILRAMLKYSTNVTAEIVGMTASLKRGVPVTTLAQSAAAMNAWAKQRFGISPRLIDHSGLGSTNRVTVSDLVTLLRNTEGSLRDILKPFLLLNDRGNLKRHSGVRIVAKSGTLNFVSNLAGYETTPHGRELVFAMICGDVARCDAVPQDQRENPPGFHHWLFEAHMLHNRLLARWAEVYDA